MRDTHIRAKAVEFALHLAMAQRAGTDAPPKVAEVLKDAQAFLGFLQGSQRKRRLRASSDRREAGRIAARAMSRAASRFTRAMRQYDVATFARLIKQVEVAIAEERRRRAIRPTGTQLAVGLSNRAPLLAIPAVPIPPAIGRPLPAQGGLDRSPWPRPVCTSLAAPQAGPVFPDKAALGSCQAAWPLPQAFGTSMRPGEA